MNQLVGFVRSAVRRREVERRAPPSFGIEICPVLQEQPNNLPPAPTCGLMQRRPAKAPHQLYIRPSLKQKRCHPNTPIYLPQRYSLVQSRTAGPVSGVDVRTVIQQAPHLLQVSLDGGSDQRNISWLRRTDTLMYGNFAIFATEGDRQEAKPNPTRVEHRETSDHGSNVLRRHILPTLWLGPGKADTGILPIVLD